MKPLRSFILFLLLALAGVIACQPIEVETPPAGETNEPAGSEIESSGVLSTPMATEGEIASLASCPQPEPGTYLLTFAAQGVCFLYPDNFDVMQAGDNSHIGLYVRSLLNTEAPSFLLHFEPADGRSLEEIASQRLADYAFADSEAQRITLAGEAAVMLDNLPGQDTNRRVVAVHDDIVYDLMVSRIGPDYGAVGEQAGALYDMITHTFQFIDVEPEASLMAGPECPEPVAGTWLYTNEADGYCLLLPDGHAVEDSLVGEDGIGKAAVYVDSLQDTSHARLFITVADADGRTLEAVTSALESEIESAVPGYDVMWSFGYMLDGVFANQFDQVPGQDLSRQVVLLHKDRLYTLTFIPDDPGAGDAYAEMQTLYDTAMESFSFLWQNQ